MTVKELIEALQKLPPDRLVMYVDSEYGQIEVTGSSSCNEVTSVEESNLYGEPESKVVVIS